MVAQERLQALSARVLGEAHERAQEATARAEMRAAAIEQRAREAGEARRRTVLSEAEQEAGRYRSRIESAAHLEAKRRLLAKREELIARALAMAHQRLLTALSPEERRAALERALLEAAAALGGGCLTVRTNPQDAAFLTPQFLAELRSRLAAEGVTAEVALGPPADISGGAVVSKEEGRVIFDNSFEARVERLQFALRNEVWQILTSGVEVAELALRPAQGRR